MVLSAQTAAIDAATGCFTPKGLENMTTWHVRQGLQ
jgi:hypothetical protein